MRDKSHKEQVERWAEFCRTHPDEWKRVQKQFIDAQFEMSERFYKKISETSEGREIVQELKKDKLISLGH